MAKSLEGDLADVFAFRATVAAALAELWTEMIKLSKTVEGNLEDDPSCDEEHDYNARCRGMIKGISECAVKLDATIAALDLTADVFDAAIASRPDVLEKLADEAVKEKQ